MMLPALTSTRALTLEIGGRQWDEWSAVELTRDLDDISGGFVLTLRDASRSRATWAAASVVAIGAAAKAGAAATISIRGGVQLIGWVDDVASTVQDGWVSLSVTGRDKTGDLVDCAASVDGPFEFRGLTLAQAMARVVKPFGLTVRDDVGLTTRHDKLSIDVGETAMSAIEKWARQEGVLITSDGIGAVVITRSGATRMQTAALWLPGNVAGQTWRMSFRDRFRDYHVKGQAGRAGGARAATPGLDATAEPLPAGDQSAKIAAQPSRETRGTEIRGDARDEEVGRYRPLVMMARTDASAPGAKTQAEWAMRTARAKSEELMHTVHGWDPAEPWRVNSLVPVSDSYAGVTADRLIAGMRYVYGDSQPEAVELRLVSPEAYDLEPVGERRADRAKGKGKKAGGPLDATAENLPS